MAKEKLLGTKYGINITRPWNADMYKHNNLVSEEMKTNIKLALKKAYEEKDDEKFIEISKYVCYYSFMYDWITDDNYDTALDDLSKMENYQLADEYPWMVSKGLVPEVDQQFVGY